MEVQGVQVIKVMVILMLMSNGTWYSSEREFPSCLRIVPGVVARLEARPEVEAAWGTCITRYKA